MIPPLFRSVLHLSTTDAVQSEALALSLRAKLSCFSLSEMVSKGTTCLDMNNYKYLWCLLLILLFWTNFIFCVAVYLVLLCLGAVTSYCQRWVFNTLASFLSITTSCRFILKYVNIFNKYIMKLMIF